MAHGRETKILVASFVVCPNYNKVVMHLLNPASQSVTLRASSCIAKLTEPDAISALSKKKTLASCWGMQFTEEASYLEAGRRLWP